MTAKRQPRKNERGPGVAPPPPEAGAAAHLIREARLRRSLSQAEVGKRAGYDQGLISRWERGRTQPSFEAVMRVLGVCGFDVWTGLTLADDNPPNGRIANLLILEENTPPDETGFKRIFREQDAARRRERARGG
ncbi:MAG: helix-turn-helix transcriptional regulator [Actinobacteria bacterium]|nr:helix-turn-helix transcriptional regulator [Actinomycetota bacterium]